MKKSLKTTIEKNGTVFTLVNPTHDIAIESLVQRFGNKVVKINHLGGGLFQSEGWFGSEKELGEAIDFSKLEWEEFEI